jgi:DNA-binding MarR family transcriptional regulator
MHIRSLKMPSENALKPENCNCFAIRQAARHVTQFYDRELAAVGLRTTQFSILSAVSILGPATINALARRLGMDRTTLGREILPLERDGLLKVDPSPSDGRAKQVRLTKTGERRFKVALAKWSQAQAQFETRFGSGKASELRGMLRGVVATELASGTSEGRGVKASAPAPVRGIL